AGADRYATAAAVSARAFPTGATTAYVATGGGFADALSGGAAAGGAAAASHLSPLLLVRPTGGVPAATVAELTRLGVTDIKIIGGPNAISAETAAALAEIGTVERIAGANRYATSVALSQSTFPDSLGGTVYIATGTNFPDALAAAPPGFPVLLVPGQGTTVPANTAAEIQRLNPGRIVILGGPGAVSAAIEAQLAGLFPTIVAPADREDFLNSTGAWAVDPTGLDDVDFWVGGLAEAVEPFGGMLGSTFNHVFEAQLEDLQFGDRFYYLFRNQGNQLFGALEANSFSSLIQRNTDGSLLPASIFSLHDPFIDLENLPNPLPAGLSLTPDGTYRWDGDEHIEIHGNRTLADRIQGGQGDDALWGYGGADRIEGGSGNDAIVAGDDDDIITDSFGDDNIKGGHGNDAIDAGPGIDLILGGSGNDFINKPVDNSDGATGFFGTGNDIFLGGTGRDTPIANEGDDWLEGGPHADLLIGDNSQQFQNDTIGGDDILNGGPGSDDMDAEGGDDITFGGVGSTDRHHGMYGFDYATFYGTTTGVDADMNFNLQPPDVTAIRDRYIQVESLSGGSGNDVLRGLGFIPDDATGDQVNWLTEEGLDLIGGLRDLLQPTTTTVPEDFTGRFMTDDTTGNLLMGGPGSDLIEGRDGDDFIDGDNQLTAQLLHVPSGERADSAATFRARIFNGTLNPGDFEIVRELVDSDDAVDTAEYLSAQLDATITDLGGGYTQVVTDTEGTDILFNIEAIQFADGCMELVALSCPVVPAVLSVNAAGGEIAVTLDLGDGGGVSTQSAPTDVQMTVQALNAEGSWVPVTGAEVDSDALVQTLTVPAGTEGNLRVVTTYVDGNGVLQGVNSEVL
ncbi:cell wall-binding repeat-containing protein, partial [Ilumatobacter sp.]|uniref:cell wall-binding repeat-containing protein n=1 Tax=Ilumatobacter sp. TaxID=1967498 RepID=UPI003C58B7C1